MYPYPAPTPELRELVSPQSTGAALWVACKGLLPWIILLTLLALHVRKCRRMADLARDKGYPRARWLVICLFTCWWGWRKAAQLPPREDAAA